MKRNTSTALLSLFALGIVFGDIGTSPIYAFQQSVPTGVASVANILGTASLIFWALMIVVSLKYLVFVLRADNDGEGGILALFSQLPKKYRDPRQWPTYSIYFGLLMGAAFLFGDGIITPAISVLSAVEGTGVINPSWVHFEVPVTVVILTTLFAVQSKGTAKIGGLFGPIMLVWFATLGGLGIRQIAKYPSVLRALSPTYAGQFLGHNKLHSFVILSSVILAITGVEALYADLGHFGARAIRLAWWLVAAPALVLNYLGQAAEEIVSPKSSQALFFNMAPNRAWLIYLVIITTVATIIASQALISGVGSISRQAVKMGLFPRLQVIHTSSKESGQIFVPVINTLVGAGTILLVIIFKTSGHLANAYSFDISGTMLITTVGFYIVTTQRWQWRKRLMIPVCVIFGLIDAGFFASTSTKLLKGAWVPLAISLAIMYFILVWRRGNIVLTRQLNEVAVSWDNFEELVRQEHVTRTATVGIFLTSSLQRIPQAALSQIRQMHVIPATVYAVEITTSDEPYERVLESTSELGHGVTVAAFRLGYMEEVDIPELMHSLMPADVEATATYYLSDRKFNNMNRGEITGMTEKVFTFLHRNSVAPARYFDLPDSRIVTLATQLDL